MLPGQSGTSSGLGRAEQIGHRLSFTIATVAMIALAGWLTNTAAGATLGAHAIRRLGFAPADTPSVNVLRAVVSAFVTNGPVAFWLALAATALLVGLTEWRHGSLRATFIFWGAHLATLVLSWVVFAPMRLAGQPIGSLLYITRDVGPSAGYVGCLGYLVGSLRGTWRWPAFATIVAVLLGMLAFNAVGISSEPAELSAAVSHLIAMLVGFGASALTLRRQPDSQDA